MTAVPVIQARELARVLRKLGFQDVRTHGSHVRFIHEDGRKTTVPFHAGRDLPKGLLRKIVTQDVGIDMAEFVRLLKA